MLGICQGTGKGWTELSGGGKGTDVAVDAAGHAWVIGTDQGIYRHDGTGGRAGLATREPRQARPATRAPRAGGAPTGAGRAGG